MAQLTDEEKKAMDEALLTAVRAGKVDKVEDLLKQGASAEAKDGNDTPLTIAVSSGNREMTQLLLDAGADVERRPGNKLSKSALDLARESGNRDITELLEGHKAKVNERKLLELVSKPYDKGAMTDIQKIQGLLQQGANPDAALAFVTKALAPYNTRRAGPEDKSRMPAINEQNMHQIGHLQEIQRLLEAAKEQQRGKGQAHLQIVPGQTPSPVDIAVQGAADVANAVGIVVKTAAAFIAAELKISGVIASAPLEPAATVIASAAEERRKETAEEIKQIGGFWHRMKASLVGGEGMPEGQQHTPPSIPMKPTPTAGPAKPTNSR